MTWDAALRRKDVKGLCEGLLHFSPTPKQESIIKKIFYQEHKRIIINCMTRYGKTRSVSAAVALYLIFNKNKHIFFVGPTATQTSIIRNYLAEFITQNPVLRNLLQKNNTGIDRIKEELSRKRMTFNNGCELTVISAEGEGERLVGFGGDLIILDESCLIKATVYRSKISRMLGDSPNAMLVEISNPWNRDNHYFEHWAKHPNFHKIHIGWQDALAEGRTTEEFIAEQRSQLTPTEFQILYDSEFPDQAVDSLFDYKKVNEAIECFLPFGGDKDKILSCDPADKGLDYTVIYAGERQKGRWRVYKTYSEAKSEQTSVAGRLYKMWELESARSINVDYGMGVGIISILKEQIPGNKCKITPCVFGSKPKDARRFLNRKAEAYFQLAELFNNNSISIPKHEMLIKELLSIKWRYSSNGKIQIVDPEDKSPDFADSLVILTWDVGEGHYYIS